MAFQAGRTPGGCASCLQGMAHERTTPDKLLQAAESTLEGPEML